jgi:hypothetical protein
MYHMAAAIDEKTDSVTFLYQFQPVHSCLLPPPLLMHFLSNERIMNREHAQRVMV